MHVADAKFRFCIDAPPEPCMSRPAQSRSEAHATKSPDLTSAEPTLKYRQPSGDVDLTRSGRSSDRIYEANPAVPSSREEKQHGRVQAPPCAHRVARRRL